VAAFFLDTVFAGDHNQKINAKKKTQTKLSNKSFH